MSHVVYITSNALGEPHVMSQVIAYLEPLTKAHTFTLITHEKGVGDDPATELARRRLDRAGIEWIPLRHRGPPIGTWLAVREGARVAKRKVREHPGAILHARSYTAASMAARAAHMTGAPWIFDMRGFYIDERIDGGLTRQGSLLERALRREERRLLADADSVVVLTEAARKELATGRPAPTRAPVDVVPCCVDPQLFRPPARPPTGSLTLAYTGSLGSFYLEGEMARFAGEVKKLRPDARFLLASRQDRAPMLERLRSEGFRPGDIEESRMTTAEVADALQRTHLGLLFVRPTFAKTGASPIKVGEYLASGVPVVVSVGCGDTPALLETEGVGVAIHPFRPETFADAARKAVALAEDAQMRERCRDAALRHYALESGVDIYARVYERLAGV